MVDADDVVDRRHIHARIVVDGIVAVLGVRQRVLTVAVGQQLLVLAVQPHLIIIGIVRVAALLTVTEEYHRTVQSVNLLNAPGHQPVALCDAVQQAARPSVVQVVVATARAVAPPQHLAPVLQQVILEHVDVDVGLADLADDHADIARDRIDAAQLQRVHRTAATQEIRVTTLSEVHLHEVVGVGHDGQHTALARVGVVPVEPVAAYSVTVGQRHLLLF